MSNSCPSCKMFQSAKRANAKCPNPAQVAKCVSKLYRKNVTKYDHTPKMHKPNQNYDKLIRNVKVLLKYPTPNQSSDKLVSNVKAQNIESNEIHS